MRARSRDIETAFPMLLRIVISEIYLENNTSVDKQLAF